MLSQKLNNGAYFLTCITLLWIFFQYLYAIPLADYQEHEAGKYFNAANYLIENGTLPNMRYLFYGTITGLIALHLKYKFSVLYIIAFQLLFNLFAIQGFGYVIKKNMELLRLLPVFFYWWHLMIGPFGIFIYIANLLFLALPFYGFRVFFIFKK